MHFTFSLHYFYLAVVISLFMGDLHPELYMRFSNKPQRKRFLFRALCVTTSTIIYLFIYLFIYLLFIQCFQFQKNSSRMLLSSFKSHSLSFYLSLLVSIFLYLSVFQLVCLSVLPSVTLSVFLFVALSIFLDVCLPFCLFFFFSFLLYCLPSCLSFYLPSVSHDVCLPFLITVCLPKHISCPELGTRQCFSFATTTTRKRTQRNIPSGISKGPEKNGK